MQQIEYIIPTSLEEALNISAKYPQDAKFISGGTDLIPQIRANILKPSILVDLRLLQLNRIRLESDFISIQSGVTHAQIVKSQVIKTIFPVLAEACNLIGGQATRNRGTLGGNIVNASPAADSVPPLLVYDSLAVIAGKEKERTISLSDFFQEYRKTILKPDEILKEIVIPIPQKKNVAKFIKIGRRRALSISIVSVAVCLTLGEENSVTNARVALGSVAPIPIRAKSAEEILIGKKLDSKIIVEAAHEAGVNGNPITDIRASKEYRRKMIEVLVRRALEEIYRELSGEINYGSY
jgi:CO/xanthine dehydrogenase FAD-binding subunit